MGAKRFVYISTNFMPPLATQVERQTKKAAEQALTEFSQVDRTIGEFELMYLGVFQIKCTYRSQYSQAWMDLRM